MKIKNVSYNELVAAIDAVNALFENNIVFKKIEPASRKTDKSERDRWNAERGTWTVTLTVKDSRKPGGRISPSGRRVSAACWHVYGEFVDALPEHAQYKGRSVVGRDQWGREKFTDEWKSPGAEWVDWNIGSLYSPLYYSEACDHD